MMQSFEGNLLAMPLIYRKEDAYHAGLHMKLATIEFSGI
jgi:hypothetical protein